MAHRRYHRSRSLWYGIRSRVFSRRFIPVALTVIGGVFLIGAATVLWWSRDLPDPENIGRGGLTESTKNL